jgi:hypothetical protein
VGGVRENGDFLDRMTRQKRGQEPFYQSYTERKRTPSAIISSVGKRYPKTINGNAMKWEKLLPPFT